MGICLSQNEGATKSKEIDAEINKDKKRIKEEKNKTAKLLLLGIGESGKSTFFKQLRQLHEQKFGDEELNLIRMSLKVNVARSYEKLQRATTEEVIDESYFTDKFTEEELNKMRKMIVSFWKKEETKTFLRKNPAAKFGDSSEYFLDNAERILSADFKPEDEDIVRVRIITTNIHEVTFEYANGTRIKLIDIGGQRGERKKWVHQFDDVTSLLYFISTSDYDMNLPENPDVNALVETITLLGKILNSEWFKQTPLILFLNKEDVFKTKFKDGFFERFFGKHFDNVKEAKQFLWNYISTSIHLGERKDVFVHWTIATDRSNVNRVYESVKESLHRCLMRDSGFDV